MSKIKQYAEELYGENYAERDYDLEREVAEELAEIRQHEFEMNDYELQREIERERWA